MKDLRKTIRSVKLFTHLKNSGQLNPRTAKLLLATRTKKDPSAEITQINTVVELSKIFRSPFEISQITDGPILIAKSEKNKIIGMHEHECHVLISGQTGCGKSTLLRLILSQALARGIKIWLFVRADDMRNLLDIDRNVLVYKFDGKIKINPLNPGHFQIKDFINIFLDIFIQSQTLYDGTKNYLQEHINVLYEKFQSKGKIPSFIDLYEHLKSLKHTAFRRITAYRDSALNRLGGLVHSTIGKVFDCSIGYENQLLRQSCIFEIQNLTTEQQRFFINFMLTKLFWHRVKYPEENWFFVAVDDGNLVFDASLEKRADLGLPIIHHLLSTVRKSKINVFCCTQTPHQIGASIHSNSAIKIMFSHANGKDLEFLHKSMGIKEYEQKQFTYALEPRQIIVKNSNRYPLPVLGTVPEIPESRHIDNQEVEQNNKIILSRFPDIVPRCPVEKNLKPASENKNNQKTEKRSIISDQIKDFLMAVNLNQYKKTSTEIYKLAGLSAGTGSRIAKQCEQKNLIKIISSRLGRGNPKYPILLPDAYKILSIEEKKFYGKGSGHEHVLYQHLIQKHFSEYKPKIELNRGGKFIDVGFYLNEQLIAIEVACTSKNEIQNIIKDVRKARAEFVVVACKNKSVLEKVVQELTLEFVHKTKVILISELLKVEPEEFLEKLFHRG